MKSKPFAPTGFGPEDIEVQVSELLVATADSSDAELDRSILMIPEDFEGRWQ